MQMTAKDKKVYMIGGAIGVGVVGWIYLKNRSGSSTPAAAATDPGAGNIDPTTGYAYGSAADTAALSANSGSIGSIGSSAGYIPISSYVNPVQTNAAWAQAAQQTLSSVGYDPETVAGALGAYLARIGLSPAQVTIVQAALAEEGPPPVGTYSVIPATPAPTTPGSGGYASNPPTGLAVTSASRDSISLIWNSVKGATSYTMAYGRTSGAQTWQNITTSTSGTIGPLSPGTVYYIEVWANPTPSGGPHAGPISAKTSK